MIDPDPVRRPSSPSREPWRSARPGRYRSGLGPGPRPFAFPPQPPSLDVPIVRFATSRATGWPGGGQADLR